MGQSVRFYVRNVKAQVPCDITMFSHYLIPELRSRSHIWSDTDSVMPPWICADCLFTKEYTFSEFLPSLWHIQSCESGQTSLSMWFALTCITPASCISGGDETKRCNWAPEAEEDHDACGERREPKVCVRSLSLWVWKGRTDMLNALKNVILDHWKDFLTHPTERTVATCFWNNTMNHRKRNEAGKLFTVPSSVRQSVHCPLSSLLLAFIQHHVGMYDTTWERLGV